MGFWTNFISLLHRCPIQPDPISLLCQLKKSIFVSRIFIAFVRIRSVIKPKNHSVYNSNSLQIETLNHPINLTSDSHSAFTKTISTSHTRRLNLCLILHMNTAHRATNKLTYIHPGGFVARTTYLTECEHVSRTCIVCTVCISMTRTN